jgi:hypothetical protein
LFALEVVLRHFAVHAFAPIVIASVAGTVINRLVFGDTAEFALPGRTALEFYAELPAYLILGLVCGLVAVTLMRCVFWADDLETRLQTRLGLPYWLRPALAGALLGLLAIWFPHIIGVGYETTSAALTGKLLLHEAIVFAMIKVAAVAITMGGRMGGGIFSPSLMIGALTGLAFGLIATSVFPEISGSHTLYALAGMGAVAAAVLGAADRSGGDGIRFALDGAGVSAGGSIVLFDTIRAAQHSLGGGTTGVFAGHVPRCGGHAQNRRGYRRRCLLGDDCRGGLCGRQCYVRSCNAGF